MGLTCIVPKCKTGKKKMNKKGRVRFFGFPKDTAQMRQHWLTAIPRKNFSPSVYSKICHRHFKDSDYKVDRSDSSRSQNGCASDYK